MSPPGCRSGADIAVERVDDRIGSEAESDTATASDEPGHRLRDRKSADVRDERDDRVCVRGGRREDHREDKAEREQSRSHVVTG